MVRYILSWTVVRRWFVSDSEARSDREYSPITHPSQVNPTPPPSCSLLLHLLSIWHLASGNEYLWDDKKTPMIQRDQSREQSTKCRSRSENMWKVVFILSSKRQDFIKHGRVFVWEIHQVRKGLWASWLCFSGADWLGRQTLITWLVWLDWGLKPRR